MGFGRRYTCGGFARHHRIPECATDPMQSLHVASNTWQACYAPIMVAIIAGFSAWWDTAGALLLVAWRVACKVATSRGNIAWQQSIATHNVATAHSATRRCNIPVSVGKQTSAAAPPHCAHPKDSPCRYAASLQRADLLEAKVQAAPLPVRVGLFCVRVCVSVHGRSLRAPNVHHLHDRARPLRARMCSVSFDRSCKPKRARPASSSARASTCDGTQRARLARAWTRTNIHTRAYARKHTHACTRARADARAHIHAQAGERRACAPRAAHPHDRRRHDGAGTHGSVRTAEFRNSAGFAACRWRLRVMAAA